MISRFLERILMEHIEPICSLEYELSFVSICSIRILDIFEVIAKTKFRKNAKCATLRQAARLEHLSLMKPMLLQMDTDRRWITSGARV